MRQITHTRVLGGVYSFFMARYNDNAPVGHTCPLIDSVISFVENNTDNGVSEIEKKEIIEVLEKIRSANDQLRTWGNELYKEKEEIESDFEYEIKELKGRIDDLEYDLREKDKEIISLEKDLSYAEKQLESVVS